MNLVTIDLDYWTMTEPFHDDHIKFIDNIAKQTDNIHVIKVHHHIVTKQLIPKSTTRIINIDFHNDIVDDVDGIPINEGTWGNYIGKHVKEFVWIYPNYKMCIEESSGICWGTVEQPFINHISYKQIHTYKNYCISDINGLVICISKKWANYDLSPYLHYLKKFT